MNRVQIGFPVSCEAQYRLGCDRSRRSTARKPHSRAPLCAITVARTGHIRNPLWQALLAMLKEYHEAVRQRGNVTSTARPRQPHQPFASSHFRRVQISEAIHLGRTQEPKMYAPG